MRSEASTSSLVILQLRRSDKVDVLETKDSFTKIRFKIDGDFPVEGWVPTDALILGASSIAAAPTQSYQVKPKEEVVSTVDEFPEMLSDEKVMIPKGVATLSPSSEETADTTSTTAPKDKTADGPWLPEFRLMIGYVNFSESLTTENSSGGYFGSPFLKYDLSGLQFNADTRLYYDMDSFQVGGALQYAFSLFKDSISASNTTIQKSNVQAQMHEIRLGPTIRTSFQFTPDFVFTPEVQALGGAQFFSTNQLVDKGATGRTGQPVLFNMTAFYGELVFIPALSLPWNFLLEPEVGVLFNYQFTESPITVTNTDGSPKADADKIRTGTPETAHFLFSYGTNLLWSMEKLGMPSTRLFVRYHHMDLSRSYSGLGNRAGIATSDVKASSGLKTIGLGIQYRF